MRDRKFPITYHVVERFNTRGRYWKRKKRRFFDARSARFYCDFKNVNENHSWRPIKITESLGDKRKSQREGKRISVLGEET